jgi:hypothetical protein
LGGRRRRRGRRHCGRVGGILGGEAAEENALAFGVAWEES